MKRKLYFIAIVLSIALLDSCKKTELYYSCNREIDHWVRENINNISKITREDFLAYRNDVDRQKAIYAALSPEQKTHLWKAKIEDVLSLSWSEKERMHIASLLTIIDTTPFFFDPSLQDKYENEIDIISYKWVSFAQEELKWQNEIYAIAMTLNPISRLDEQLIVDESHLDTIKSTKTRSEVLACSCHTTSGITNGACTSGYKCVTGNCEEVRNCGVLGASKCIGICTESN